MSVPPSSPRADAAPRHRYTPALAAEIEQRWQDFWASRATFRTPNPGEAGFDPSRPKFYCLDMFPYPSGAGLHVGHPEGYTATDIVCRYKRMKGFNVLHPMGYDAFGLPAEQYAIQTGVHPAITTRQAIENFRRQLRRFGFSYDWSREISTIDPEYYRWTQWIFLRLYDSWYDREAVNPSGTTGRVRPISELRREFEHGARAPAFNPDASELSAEELARPLAAWSALDARTRRRIIDSWRLAYVGEQTVNWCPALGTVLANDEVIDGRSERGGHPVVRRPLKQWMFRITALAQRLLDDLEKIDWPESTRTMQREWIGRSEGAEIEFPLAASHVPLASLRVFTTRPDTIFGATYMVVAPEHALIQQLLQSPAKETDVRALRDYVEAARRRSDVDRQAETREKTGVFTGVRCVNPANGAHIPVWTADYVLMGYGTGAIMAVPAHDQRDFEFASKYRLPVVEVVQAPHGWDQNTCFSGEGPCINSANKEVSLNGLETPRAKQAITDWLERTGRGRRRINYKLRDWTFSRQRYWGEPFPIVFDENGDHYPVSESALPVVLPELADYRPVESPEPQPLLAKATAWIHTTAGAAGVDPDILPPGTPVRREANTMPGSAGSSWYFLRYCDAHNPRRFASREAERYWMLSEKASAQQGGSAISRGEFDPARHHVGGVDLYVGGAEHAVGHLLYARFWHKALFDLGEVSCPEPFGRLFHQGMITSYAYQRADKSLVPIDQVEELPPEGSGRFVIKATGEPVTQIVAKMSKTLKNVVNPDDVIAEFGADTFRLYEMYMGPLDASKPWNTRDIIGLFRFLQRAWRLVIDEETGSLRTLAQPDPGVEKLLHRTIDKVGRDIESLAMNTAIAALIEFVNAATSSGGLTRDQLERFALILSPFAPHIAEELWHRAGRNTSLAHEPWPGVNASMLRDEEIELAVQILGKVRGRLLVPSGADAREVERLVLADEKVRAMIEGKTVQKVIVVPGRLVNLVVK